MNMKLEMVGTASAARTSTPSQTETAESPVGQVVGNLPAGWEWLKQGDYVVDGDLKQASGRWDKVHYADLGKQAFKFEFIRKRR